MPQNIHYVEVVLCDVLGVDTYDIFVEELRGDNNVWKLEKRHGSSGHMTFDDVEYENDSNDEGVSTTIKVSNMAQSFGQFVMTKKNILDSVFEYSKTLRNCLRNHH